MDPRGDQDWFQFETIGLGSAEHFVGIDFDHALGNLDLTLYNAAGDFLTHSVTHTDNERISLSGMPAGNYLLRVASLPEVTHPNYTLKFFAPEEAVRDWAEDNDTRETAYNFFTVEGLSRWDELSINPEGDIDWFSFTTSTLSNHSHGVTIDFLHALGDINAELTTPREIS